MQNPMRHSRRGGSPPRAWGRHDAQDSRAVSVRFTPTCEGKTVGRIGRRRAILVHPHVRGEDLLAEDVVVRPAGSPPRAWGRHSAICHRIHHRRFTPTCVGKTWHAVIVIIRIAVHPHVRGEDGGHQSKTGPDTGSPPRAWGRRPIARRRRVGPRFTPTCVGKTIPLRGKRTSLPVHPHVRGEDGWFRSCSLRLSGSPPRAWGRQ